MAANSEKLIKRFKSDKTFRNKVGLYYGATLNLLFVIMQLYGGIRYQSVWFTALAVYYAVLAGVKIYLGRSIGKRGADRWAAFRIVGLVMTILNLALAVMISYLIAEPSIALHKYSLTIAIITAVWTLASAVTTFVGLVKMKGKNTPVPLAAKWVQMISSVVSVLILQTAMIASISAPQIERVTVALSDVSSLSGAPDWVLEWPSGTFRILATSNSVTGLLVMLFVLGSTLYIIIRGTVERKK